MNSYCHWLVELGRFSQYDVDCYNSLVSHGAFKLDCLFREGRIYACLNPAALCNTLEDTSSSHDQLELIVWFPTHTIEMIDKDSDDIYVSDLMPCRHWFFRHVQ